MPDIFSYEGVNFGGRKGVELQDPKNDRDAVNLRTLRHWVASASADTLSKIALQNLGVGYPIYKGQTGSTYYFRTITAGTNMVLTSGDTIILSTNSAVTFSMLSANTISASTFYSGSTPIDQIFVYEVINLGQGPAYVYSAKTGGIIYLTSFSAGTNLNVVTGATNTFNLNPFISVSGLTATTISAGTISAYSIDVQYYYSGGTLLNFNSSFTGITAIVNTGLTHGIHSHTDPTTNIAYLKSLSGSPNISIYSSSTENSVRLNDNISINGLTANTITATTISANTIDALLYLSGGTPFAFLSDGIRYIVNTGATHGIYSHTDQNLRTAYLKSLSGSPNISIYSSTTENSIRLNSYISVSGLTAGTIFATLITASTISAVTIDAQFYTSGGTPLNFVSTFTGITAIVNTGATHGIWQSTDPITNTAYLKSLSGSPNISIYSSSTENSIRLNDNISINGLTANTITATTISANTIDALLYLSGGSPFNFVFDGVRSIVNTGATHGIWLSTDPISKTAYLKSLSGSPFISIYSSSTENSIRLNPYIEVLGLTGTSISAVTLSASTYLSGSTPIDQIFVYEVRNLGQGPAYVFSAKTGGIIYLTSFSAGTNMNVVTGATNTFNLNPYIQVIGLTASTLSALTITANTIYSGSNNIDYLFSHTGHTHEVRNIGTGNAEIYKQTNAGVIELRTLSGGNATEITTGDTHVISHTLWTSGQTGTKSIMVLNSGSIVSGNFNLAAGQLNTNQSNYATVAGGKNNIISASSTYSFIGAGTGNIITASTRSSILNGTNNKVFSANNSIIGSGYRNKIYNNFSFIGGGQNNKSSSYAGFIGAGYGNSALTGNRIFIGAGLNNYINSTGSAIVGGSTNIIKSTYSFIGGGVNNKITGVTATNLIVGGQSNKLYDGLHSVIVGGFLNKNYSTIGTIVGGRENFLSGNSTYSFIGGGHNNILVGQWNFIGGGFSNKLYGEQTYNFIGGGTHNILSGSTSRSSSIVGGNGNNLDGINSFIGGGYLNKNFSNFSSIVGGYVNSATTGLSMFIGGGESNFVTGNASFIGGGRLNKNFAVRSAIVAGQSNSAITSSYIFIGAGLNNLSTGSKSVIVGGNANQSLLSSNSFIGAGDTNFISGASTNSAILAGGLNKITGVSTNSILLGGSLNKISNSISSSVLGGKSNEINDGYYSVIVAGKSNYITDIQNFIGAGNINTVLGNRSFIGAGNSNYLNGTDSVIIGGYNNSNVATRSFIGSGIRNYNRSLATSIVGGSYNSAQTGNNIFIGGGNYNRALAHASSIVGGRFNYIRHEVNAGNGGIGAFIGGGARNSAMTSYAVIVGGSGNVASGTTSFIGSGGRNKILGVTQNCGIVTGQYNLIFNGIQTVKYTTISGGQFNTATTNFSFIGNGKSNLISAGTYSSIIGGNLNKLYGTRSAIIGGLSLSLSMNDCVMVPRLRINSTPAGGTYSLSVDSSGYVYRSALAGVGEANTASNIGGDYGLYASKVGVDLKFKSLSAGTNITITSSATELTINSTPTAGTVSSNDNGLNTYTGGTSAFQTINVSALTIDHLTVSGATILNTLSALTVSATTFYSGYTELSTLFTNYWTAGDLGTESIKTVGGSNYVNGNHSLAAGQLNNVTSIYSVIIGGSSNKVLAAHSSIVGGQNNIISGGNAFYSFIGGGQQNKISTNSARSSIIGGSSNIIGSITDINTYSRNSFIGGGYANKIGENERSFYSFLGGGQNNRTVGYKTVLVGGRNNLITGNTIYTSGTGSALVGGRDNTIRGAYSFIGGGGGNLYSVTYGNFINGNLSVIVGGKLNIVSGNTSFVGGGQGNKTYSVATTIVGGLYNFISNASIASTISGGYKNRTYGGATFNGGGSYNWILAGSDNSSIVAGLRNKIYGKHSLIGGGYKNVINSSNFGSPYSYSAILSGRLNTGSSTYSFISNGINNIIQSGGTLNAIINSSGSTIDYNLTGVTIISLTGFTASRNHTVYIPDAVVVNLSGATTRMVVAQTDGLLQTQAIPSFNSTILSDGINTFTGGTIYNPSVNITGGGFTTIFVSGNSTFNTITATTISATTYFSGSTDLSLLLGEVNVGLNVGGGVGIYSGKTGSTLLFKTISAGTNMNFYTGNTDSITLNSSYDVSGFRKSGSTTTGHTIERWYNSQTTAGGIVTVGGLPSNRLYAAPFIVSKPTSIDRIAFEVVATGNTNCIVGIYDSTDNSTPRNLIYGGTSSFTADTTTIGAKPFSATGSLSAGLYWLTIGPGTVGTTTFRGFSTASGLPAVVGWSSALGGSISLGYVHPHTYNNSLPSQFPVSALTTSTSLISVWIRNLTT